MGSTGSTKFKWWMHDIDHQPDSLQAAEDQLAFFKLRTAQGKSVAIEGLRKSGSQIRVVFAVFSGLISLIMAALIIDYRNPLCYEFWGILGSAIAFAWLTKITWTMDTLRFQTGLNYADFEQKIDLRIDFLEEYLEKSDTSQQSSS
jgi:hypothetical protein